MTDAKEKKKPVHKRTEARVRAENKYKRERMTSFNLRLTNTVHADVIEKLNTVPNRRQYLIGLVREDIARGNDE